MKYKTNIKCEGCIEKVTPGLNKIIGVDQWSVDLLDPERTLSVPDTVTEAELNAALNPVGYKAEKMKNMA